MITLSQQPVHRQSQQGFTLVEIMVALALTSFVLASLAGAVHVLGRSWTKNTENLMRQDMITRALAILSRDVHGMQRLRFDAGNDDEFIFDGGRDQLQLVTVEPPYPSRPGLYFIRYRVVREGRGYALLRERAPFRPGLRNLNDIDYGDAVILVEGPYRYIFAYATIGKKEINWQKDWPLHDHLPQLLCLTVTDIKTGRLLFSPYIVKPKINAEPSCILPKSPKCSVKRPAGMQRKKPGSKAAIAEARQ